jgi:iron complex transport system substrate-binding protein
VRAAVAGQDRPRTLALEWSDPPFSGGHWVPDMIDAAGGDPVLAEAGSPSRRLRWEELADAAPDVVVIMPCGYGLEAAADEGGGLLTEPSLAGAGIVCAANGDAYFSRPGPRVVTGVEALASVLHPGAVPPPMPGVVRRLRP